jgi:hypothetical protein
LSWPQIFDKRRLAVGKTILVLTNTEDGIHSDVVISKLLGKGLPVFRFNSDLVSGGRVVVNFVTDENGAGLELVETESGQRLLSEDVGSVWYRRPNIFRVGVGDQVQRAYAEAEIKTFLDGLWLVLSSVFWMNSLGRLEQARRKILQLHIAKRLGFLLPKTLVTNDPGRARDFFRLCGGKMVFKCIGQETLDYADKSFTIPTTLLTEVHMEKIELVKSAPALLQEFVVKTYDVRVTIVGQKSFSVKIDSQDDPLTMVDWRHPQRIGTLHYSETQIPKTVTNLCFRMMDELGLVFGAFDFAVDAKGQYYFLELNPNGQWYWLEHFTGLLISDAIADILVKERR